MTETQMMRSSEVCRYLNISKNTLNKWHNAGVIPFVECGRVRRTPRRIVEAFIQRHLIAKQEEKQEPAKEVAL